MDPSSHPPPRRPRSLQVKAALLGSLIGTLTGGMAGASLGWALWNSPQRYYQISGRTNAWSAILENAVALALAGLMAGALLGGMVGALCEHWKSRRRQLAKDSDIVEGSGADQ